MSTEEVKIYTTFDSFEADQVISTLALRAVYRNSYGAYDDA